MDKFYDALFNAPLGAILTIQILGLYKKIVPKVSKSGSVKIYHCLRNSFIVAHRSSF